MSAPGLEQRPLPEDTIRHPDVAVAVRELERMKHHPGLASRQREFIVRGLECCQTWLANPDGASLATRKSLSDVLKHRTYLPRVFHPELQPLKSVFQGMKILVDQYTELCQKFPHQISQYEEFGDVFEPLTNVLRCSICFGSETFNEIDPETGRQYEWTYIGSVLRRYPFLPIPAWFREQAKISSTVSMLTIKQTSLVVSLRAACNSLRIDFNALAWQFIKYNLYLEVPRGPKMSLRTGQWKQLATNISQAISTLKSVARLTEENHRSTTIAALSLLQSIHCTQYRWFETLRSPDDFSLSNEAIELSRRLAETGDPRNDQSLRCEPLLDFSMYGKVKATHLNGVLFRAGQRLEVDQITESLMPEASNTFSAAPMLTNTASTPAEGQPQRGSPVSARIEPIPGYSMAAHRKISRDRARALLEAYQHMTDLHQRSPHHPGVEDLNLTLLMAILHPSLYRVSFIQALPLFAGQSDSELEVVNLVRLPHRGLASKITFDGLFHVNAGRNTIPNDAAHVVAAIMSAYDNENEDFLIRHGFHINARNCQPLYSAARILTLVPVLRGIFDHQNLPPSATPAEQRRHNLRLVDLTLTLYTLTRENDIEAVLGSVATNFGVIIRCAGDDEAALNRVGLSRQPRLGLIGVDGSFIRSLRA
ncbi:hypothetical protein PRK78_001638 [Emydomyces testavorans]|uniref:Uncharacterized protein n=1 Tax=Emydomyces testavorans TaxID=2070801 RepID=A0AAF0IH24_9EURO|nr:hypothetical protein PRK78_001638 [Emydomyces testavorans]